MHRSGSLTLPLSLMALAVVALEACFPNSSPELAATPKPDCTSTSCEQALSNGMLAQDGFKLSWSVSSSWDNGWCLDLELFNYKEDVDFWLLETRLSSEVTLFSSFNGVWMDISGDHMVAYPCCGLGLECNRSAQFQYCVEPQVSPVEILKLDLSGASSTPGQDPSDTSTPATVNSLQDEPLLLSYRTNGTSKGGTCLEFTVTNLSSKALAGWQARVSLDRPALITDYWSFTPSLAGTSLILYPGSGFNTLDPYQARTGTVCFDPLVEPQALESVVQYDTGTTTGGDDSPTVAPTPTEAPTPTQTPVPTVGSLEDPPLVLSYRSKGVSNGGTCLELSFFNASSQYYSAWQATIGLAKNTALTDYWGITPSLSGTRLTIYPGSGQGTLDPYQSRVGTVCMNPLVDLVSLDAAVQVKTTAKAAKPAPAPPARPTAEPKKAARGTAPVTASSQAASKGRPTTPRRPPTTAR